MRPNPTQLAGWEVLFLCIAFVLMCFTVDGENDIPPAAAEFGAHTITATYETGKDVQ